MSESHILIDIPESSLTGGQLSLQQEIKNQFCAIQNDIRPGESTYSYSTWFFFFLKCGKSLFSQTVQSNLQGTNVANFFRNMLSLTTTVGGGHTVGYNFFRDCLLNSDSKNIAGIKFRRVIRDSHATVGGQLQLITYGAPGTGKSHKIDKSTNESNSIRVTFHPDTDYATFVGAYKPFAKEEIRYGLNGTNTVAMKVGSADLTEDKISYKFVPQAFMKAYVEAWKRYTNPGLQGDAKTYYLVIEEINRGNCAQIFGDLFQLLDRADNGFSAYAITPDDDIQKFLEKDETYKLADIPLADDIKKMTEDGGEKVIASVADIKTGKKLVLPPNLCIWATMNTSDQSLFPMDSAFKRRWEWEYMPIKDEGKNWKIKVDADEYKWWSFLEKINDVIAEHNSSEDKQLGYFFARPKGGGLIIDADDFVSKIIFYLWKDGFKDDLPQTDPFKYTFKEGEPEREIRFTDFYQHGMRDKLIKHFLDKLGAEKVTAETPQNNTSQNAAGEAENSDVAAEQEAAVAEETTTDGVVS